VSWLVDGGGGKGKVLSSLLIIVDTCSVYLWVYVGFEVLSCD
jgi:hypothetical protein